MVWAILFVLVMVVGFPVAVMFGGAAWSALFGFLTGHAVEQPDRAPVEGH
jgi:hypothetical protein